MNQSITLRLIPALIAVAFGGSAHAAGFQLLEQNASSLGNAYAGSAAVAENASTVFFNPAGMTELKNVEVSGGVTAINTKYQFNNTSSSTGSLSGNSDGGNLGFVPNAYMSMALTKDLYFGLGIGAPFGLKTEYDNPWYGAAQSVMFQIKTLNVNPSIAWRAADWVSLGFGVNWQKLDADYLRDVGIRNTPGVINVAGSMATLNLSGDAWGWNAGALFHVGPATKIGISYRSVMKYDLKGDVAITSNGDATANNTTRSLNAAGAGSNVGATVKLPDTFILSATHKFNDQWEMLSDVSWTGWSSIPKIDIIRTTGALNGQIAQTLNTDFRDTWRVALGANYTLNDAWKLKAGIAYDQTPVKGADSRLVSLPDNDRTWFSLGAQWKPSKNLTLDIGAAYLYLQNADINNNQTPAVNTLATASQNRGTVTGTYDDSAWLLGTQLSMAF